MELTSWQSVVDCFTTIFTAAQNFLATIWPVIEILRSLIVHLSIRRRIWTSMDAVYSYRCGFVCLYLRCF